MPIAFVRYKTSLNRDASDEKLPAGLGVSVRMSTTERQIAGSRKRSSVRLSRTKRTRCWLSASGAPTNSWDTFVNENRAQGRTQVPGTYQR